MRQRPHITWPNEVRERAKREGLGLIGLGYQTKDGCGWTSVGPGTPEEIRAVIRLLDQIVRGHFRKKTKAMHKRARKVKP